MQPKTGPARGFNYEINRVLPEPSQFFIQDYGLPIQTTGRVTGRVSCPRHLISGILEVGTHHLINEPGPVVGRNGRPHHAFGHMAG